MFAIVEACGRQYQLEAGRFIDLHLQDVKEGDSFQFDKVLMLVDGASSTIGAPFIDGAKVTGRVLKHGKNKKIIVYHMKPKKGTRKKQGHRSHYTRVLIDTIELKDKVLAKNEEQERPKKEAKAKAEPKAKEKQAAPAKAEKPKAKAGADKASKAKAEPAKKAKKGE